MRLSRAILCVVVTLGFAAPAVSAPITYTFSGLLSTVTEPMDFLMPNVDVGTAFTGTLVLGPYLSSTTLNSADLRIEAGDQVITARSVGIDPLASFAAFTPVGPLSSPTLLNGYIDNVYFAFATGGTTVGRLGFTVFGRDPVAGPKYGEAWGEIDSVTNWTATNSSAANTVPEPTAGILTLLGMGAVALRSRVRILLSRREFSKD